MAVHFNISAFKKRLLNAGIGQLKYLDYHNQQVEKERRYVFPNHYTIRVTVSYINSFGFDVTF